MFYIYRSISDFYSKQYGKELKRRGFSTLAAVLNEKRTFWYAKMLHAQGRTFIGWIK
jgi:hypothetical protein